MEEELKRTRNLINSMSSNSASAQATGTQQNTSNFYIKHLKLQETYSFNENFFWEFKVQI